jgi:hypothetical protein
MQQAETESDECFESVHGHVNVTGYVVAPLLQSACLVQMIYPLVRAQWVKGGKKIVRILEMARCNLWAPRSESVTDIQQPN